MKKLLYLFGAILLALGSCTSDYDGSCVKNDEKPIKNDTITPPKTDSIPVVAESSLLKKWVQNYADGKVSTIELSYDKTKMMTRIDEFGSIKYTYTGDVITKIELLDTSENIYLTKEYFYKNGKLDYILSNENGKYFVLKYVYNDDGSIFFYKSYSDSSATELSATEFSGRYVFSEGNLIQYQKYMGNASSVLTYEYDSKNNPKLNVLGFNLLHDMRSSQEFNVNNIVKVVSKIDDIVEETTNYTYEYDANGYPTKITRSTERDGNITIDSSLLSYYY